MSEPSNFFNSLAGVKVLYDRINPSDYGVRGVNYDFHVPKDFGDALDRGFQDLWDICPLGPAQTILSAGTYSNRPPSQHALGRAMDIDAILWSERRFVTLDYPTDSVFYLGVESVLRRNFDYVLNYLYNADHHDHFHVDLSGSVGFSKTQKTKVNYIQALCSKVLGLPVSIDGSWGASTQDGLDSAQKILGVPGDLSDLARWKEFLLAAARHSFSQALHVSVEQPHHSNVVALNNAIEVGMAGHRLRKFALSQVAMLDRRLRDRGASAATAGLPGEILQIAAESEIAGYSWPGRGVAPKGYIQGMALVFARSYCRLKGGDHFAVEMAKADSGSAVDALTWYREEFDGLNMDNSVAGPETLRHLFTLLTGLGMRESSGNYCTGTDDNFTADTAEAGLFQTSFNARLGSKLLPELFDLYKGNPVSVFLNVFKKGAVCTPSDAVNYGSGDGHDFQQLEKSIPEFAAEFTAVAMRHLGGRLGHWGPLRKKAAEVNAKCDKMFKQVQDAVDSMNLCPMFSPSAVLDAVSMKATARSAIKAIDSSAKTTGKARDIKATGYDAVGVYLRPDRCSSDMIAELQGAGLKIWSTYEKGHPDHTAYFTAEQGATDGSRAAAFAGNIGQPTGTQIYATVDYDPDDSDSSGPTINGPISDYMEAFQSAVQKKGYVASVYGSGRTCRILIAKGLAQTGWLTLSTGFAEHNAFKPQASIVQIAEISGDWDSDSISDPSKPGLW